MCDVLDLLLEKKEDVYKTLIVMRLIAAKFLCFVWLRAVLPFGRKFPFLRAFQTSEGNQKEI